MAKANFKRIEDSSYLDDIPIEDGAFIVTGDGKTFIDYDNERIPVGGTPDTEMSDRSRNAVENNVIKQYVDSKFEIDKFILWTNPNPTSTFTPQTITLNSDDYDCYEIIFRFTSSLNRTNSTGKVLKGSGTICTYAVGGNYYRTIDYASDTSLNVGAGQVITTFGGTPNTDNSWCIPLYVIGYKTGLFE